MIIPPVKNPLPEHNNGRWIFPEKLDPTKYVGFLYVVRDNYLERFYFGKKNYKIRRGRNKGQEFNWRKYNTSSPLMKELLAERGYDEFEFIVLEQYETQATLSYAETWTLCKVEAPTNVKWYNTRIEKVSWTVKEPISERHKDRLTRVINMEKMDA